MQNIINGALLIVVFCLFACKQSTKKEIIMTQSAPSPYPELLNADFVTGKFIPEERSDFEEVDVKFADRAGMLLYTDTYQAFKRMWDSAATEGIRLQIISATRNFDRQKSIWQRKWNGQTILSDGQTATEIKDPVLRAKKILLYSSMPGTSRHHWGTDIDLNSLTNSWFLSGEGKRVYEWLTSHADHFGFCQPYTDKKSGRTGYEEEKWHWSYFPVSAPLVEFCRDSLSNEKIKGFDGDFTATPIDVVGNYVMGISTRCIDRN